MATITAPAHTQESTLIKLCRFCGAELRRTFVDLGMSPPCETYPLASDLLRGEVYYPLHAYVCERCFLVQLEQYQSRESIFSDYPYFSSYSTSWLAHSKSYCEAMIERLGLSHGSLVVEIASNDGYLLQYFVQRRIPVMGIEPAANVAEAAISRGVPTLVKFFGTQLAIELASQGRKADLLIGNNVLAQVPNLNDFVEGLRILLKPNGVLTLEFPHLLRLIEHNEFDTIYHEHFSYFSMLTTLRILETHGLEAFHVEELHTHGGSLRVYAGLAGDHARAIEPSIAAVLAEETKAGLDSLWGYDGFSQRVTETKLTVMDFLLTARRQGKHVAGYGAPGKSATLLHYCGIGKDLIQYTVDRSPHKQGRLLPGTHIPIYDPSRIAETRPDYIVILPWNLKDEIMEQLQFIREWGGRFMVPIPRAAIY